MDIQSVRAFPLRALISIASIIGLLIVELVATILVYTGLNVYSFNLFGMLVRFAGSVGDILSGLITRFVPGSANAAYASLFGELGPKAILLLLLGLVVATIIRGIVGLIASIFRPKSG